MLWITEVTVVKACHMCMHNLLQGFLCLDERSKRSWSEHPPYEQEQKTLQWRTFTDTLSTLQEKGDFNGGHGRIQTPAFSTRTEH